MKNDYKWELLWEIATGEPEEDGWASITPMPDLDHVILTHPDGSVGVWEWKNGMWHAVEPRNACPGDIAARDAL